MSLVSHHPIRQLDADWRAMRGSPASVEALRRLCRCEPVVRRLVERHQLGDLVELVEALRPRSGLTDSVEASQVVRGLLRSARAHELLGRAALQALVPGLLGLAARLRWGQELDDSGGRGPFMTEVVATAWEVIRAWSGDDRPYAAPDVLSAVRCRMRRRIEAEARFRARCPPTAPSTVESLAG